MANLVNNLGGPDGFGTNSLAKNDDGSTAAISVTSIFPNGISLFGQSYSSIYINNNGNITFSGALSTYTPQQIGTGFTAPIIAPFWADVDTRGSAVTPTGGGTAGTNLVWYNLDPTTHTITITWDDVGYYSSHNDKVNAFQLQLVALPSGVAEIRFIYQNIAWVAGDASGGAGGLGGTPARIGYSSGRGTYYEIPESANQAALLALPTTGGNNGTPGAFEYISTGSGIYAFAVASVTVPPGNTAGSVAFGRRHVGDVLDSILTIANTAAAPAESLDASIAATTGAATASGTIQLLAAGQSDVSSLHVGLSTASEGLQRGTVSLALASDGQGTTGNGSTALPSQSVTVTGAIYAYAAPLFDRTTVDVAARVGDAVSTAILTLRNGGAADPYREGLTYQIGMVPSPYSLQGAASGSVAAGSQATLTFTAATSTAGQFDGETVTVGLTSTGAGTSGLADTALPSQTLTLDEVVYAPAVASVQQSAIDFGIVHVGDSVQQAITVANSGSGALTDVLTGGFGVVAAGFNGTGSLSSVASGQTGTLTVGVDTSSAGARTGMARLTLQSHDPDLADIAVATAPVSLTATVDNYAAVSIGGAQRQADGSYLLDLGDIPLGSGAASVALSVLNNVAAPGDDLGGTFTIEDPAGGFVDTGFGAVSGLAPGQSVQIGSVALDASHNGSLSETIVFHPTGSNASGYAGSLADTRITVVGHVGSITAPPSPPTISRITPDHGSDLGSVTLTIGGASLRANEQAAIIAPDGTVRNATAIRYAASGQIWATFDLRGLAIGSYDVRVTDDIGTSTLPSAFQVTNGPAGQLSVQLALPETTAQGSTGTAVLTYSNTGQTDIAAPILSLNSALSTLALTTVAGSPPSNDVQLLGTSASGPAGILQPGASGSVSVNYTPTTVAGTIVVVSAGTPTAGTPIDLSSLEAALRPDTVDSTDWHHVFTAFLDRVGGTTDSLAAALAGDATTLAQAGQPTNDIATLLQYELLQASGSLAGTYLTSATDIGATSSSFSLSLARFYDGTLLGRDAGGAFGAGWASTYDVRAVTGSDGTVSIVSPGALHVFSLGTDGSYTSQTSDAAALTVVGGAYRLQLAGGTVEQFRADGTLGSITDTNGNTIALSYTADDTLQTVQSLTTGETITFASNAAGRITSATDSDGRSVSYAYDPSGTTLLSATSAAGTTSYAYVPATGSLADNALASITSPDGTRAVFTYDAEGRLASQSGDGGAGLVSYDYSSPGTVAVTDALGTTTRLIYGASGTVAAVQDAQGNVTSLQNDAAENLTKVLASGGSAYRYAYDSGGNLTGYTDPLGGTVSAAYASGGTTLTSFTDQRGNTTAYTYDAAGNVTGIRYQDGSGAAYSYDTHGLLTASTDANGATTRYAYDAAGQLISKVFADGTSDSYAYDAHGNLVAATAQDGGTTRYTHDGADRLLSVTDAQGRVESYTYNVLGQLASRTLPDGTVTQYGYDANGRITTLSDGAGNLLDRYTYNGLGEVVRTDTGSSAFTTYTYDANGNALSITTMNADGTIGSALGYTYDALGRVTVQTTSNGTWNYGYDTSGQLTRAVFASTDPQIHNQDLRYIYDAAGNRITTTVNGVTTDYTTNSLNQYTAAGETTFRYDADGNLVSATDSSGTTVYTHGLDGKLVSKVGPDGSYQFQYDALGNLIETTQNGEVTAYVRDPLALSINGTPLSEISQSYDNSGSVINSYDYGNGLSSIASRAGYTYPVIDLSENIIGLTSVSGQLNSTDSYSPFGEIASDTNRGSASLTFGGGLGLLSAGSQVIMGSRVYDPMLARFISTDPTGLAGGTNPYQYALNEPITLTDPTGDFIVLVIAVGGGIIGGLADVASRTPTEEQAGSLGYLEAFGRGFFSGSVGALAGAFALPLGPYAAGAIGGLVSSTLDTAIAAAEGNKLDLPSIALQTALGAAGGKIFDGVFKLVGRVPDIFAARTLEQYGKNSTRLLKQAFSGAGTGGVAAIAYSRTIAEAVNAKLASLFPDPHLTTFDGLHYDFQTAGEFVLARSTTGSNFQLQARLSAPTSATTYSVVTELGIQVGADRVTIDATRAAPVWVNGAAATLTNGILALAGGTLIRTAGGVEVALATGEIITASFSTNGTNTGPRTTSHGIATTVSLSPTAQPGSVEGLLGNDNGDPKKDLTLADGTVLPTTMPLATLYGAYADAWRVTQPTSLLDYGAGETTDNYTDRTYPGSRLTLSSFPQAAVDAATALAIRAGISDPGLLQSAAYDYLVTGDPAFFTTESNLQQRGITTTEQADFTRPAPTVAQVGILAAATSQVEAASGATTITFQLYRTGDTSGAVTVGFAVVAPDGSFLGTDAFGGTLPSGTVTFDAGQTTSTVSIVLPAGIGASVSKTLKLQLSGPATLDIIGGNAQIAIANSAPVAGPAPDFAVEVVNGSNALPVTANHLTTIDLGNIQQGGLAAITLAILNTAATGADNLSGTVGIATQTGFNATVVPAIGPLVPGAMRNSATVTLDTTTIGLHSETLTFTPLASNLTGYTAALPTETVTISANVIGQGAGSQPGTLVTSTPVYRFFDTNTGAEFLTTSDAERAVILQTRPDLVSEGTGFSALPLGAADPTSSPVFRFFETTDGSHFYTASAAERDTILATRSDLTFEGEAFNEYTTLKTGTTAVYRFFETQTGSHFYTASATERANIPTSRPDLMPEGIAFYAPVS